LTLLAASQQQTLFVTTRRGVAASSRLLLPARATSLVGFAAAQQLLSLSTCAVVNIAFSSYIFFTFTSCSALLEFIYLARKGTLDTCSVLINAF
jgi:hypothetical protein